MHRRAVCGCAVCCNTKTESDSRNENGERWPLADERVKAETPRPKTLSFVCAGEGPWASRSAHKSGMEDLMLADVMDAKTLPQVKMPNRDGFVRDPRPGIGK